MKKRLIAITTLALAIATIFTLFTVPVSAATVKPVSKGLGVIGSIQIAGTKINYPIVVATDNKYYLNRSPKAKKDSNGSIFMDFRNRDPNRRRNIILYGHNMRSGKMFATLHYFEKQTFFDKYTKINLELFNHKYEYEIVLGAQFNVKEFNHTTTLFKDDAEFKAYLDKAVSKAKYIRTGFVPTGKEDILTLSTCVSRRIRNYNNYRWVVMAKRVKDNGSLNPVTIN